VKLNRDLKTKRKKTGIFIIKELINPLNAELNPIC